MNPDACNSRQGRLRDYTQYGIEPRLRLSHSSCSGSRASSRRACAPTSSCRSAGSATAASPEAATGTLVEDNERDTDAYAFFAQNRFSFGPVTVTPAVRLESIRSERTNDLTPVPRTTIAPTG